MREHSINADMKIGNIGHCAELNSIIEFMLDKNKEKVWTFESKQRK